jgi:peptide chain release factor 1
VGTADRAEKIRTYNYPQDRITDHRIATSFHGIQRAMDGGLDSIVDALVTWEQSQLLEGVLA